MTNNAARKLNASTTTRGVRSRRCFDRINPVQVDRQAGSLLLLSFLMELKLALSKTLKFKLYHILWNDRFSSIFFIDVFTGPALTRCSVERDAGYTKASLSDNDAEHHYFCVFFARGCCHLGPECTFLHRIPTPADEKWWACQLWCCFCPSCYADWRIALAVLKQA